MHVCARLRVSNTLSRTMRSRFYYDISTFLSTYIIVYTPDQYRSFAAVVQKVFDQHTIMTSDDTEIFSSRPRICRPETEIFPITTVTNITFRFFCPSAFETQQARFLK